MHLCAAKRDGKDYSMETAFADFNQDGLEDVVVRTRSLFECGLRGCHTEIYLASTKGQLRRKVWRRDHPPSFTEVLITDGRVARCRVANQVGIAFPDRSPGFACFTLR